MYAYTYTRHIIFGLTIIFSCFFLFVLIFPNYIISHSIEIIPDGFENDKSSSWFLPLLISNGIFFVLLIIYRLDKLPRKIVELKNNFQKRDISKNVAFVIVVSILSFYVIFSADEFYREELEFGDYEGALEGAKTWSEQIDDLRIEPFLRYFFLFLSLEYLGNIRFLPFIASIGLLILTYFVTKEITRKRSSGVISFVTLLQSNLFLLYDTTSTYENFWTVFYLLSIYLMMKNSITSTFSFVLTLFLKPITILFLPINILWSAFDQKIKNRKKSFFGFVSIVVLIVIAASSQNLVHANSSDLDFERFVLGFNEIGNSLRFDNVILIIFIPIVILLYIQSKNQTSRKVYILFAIFITMISQPILYGIIDMTIQPYRFIPLVVFVSIGFGLIFSKESIVK